MKKPRSVYEYQFKFKVNGKKAIKSWGKTYGTAFTLTATILKGEGYEEKGAYKIGPGRYIIRFVKTHQFGQKTLVVYVTRLPGRRPVSAMQDRPSRSKILNP
jgi:hypothetical protein